MSKWNIRPGEPVDPEKVKKIAYQIWEGLVCFNLMRTRDPGKKAALGRLIELRLEIQEQLDVLAPGYLEERGDDHE